MWIKTGLYATMAGRSELVSGAFACQNFLPSQNPFLKIIQKYAEFGRQGTFSCCRSETEFL